MIKRAGTDMIAEKIKQLREKHNLTQSETAKRLGITRSGVNAWEMGLTIPSTQYIVELARLFHVSTDYLLGVSETATVSVDGLDDRDVAAVVEIIECLREKSKTK